MDQKNSFIMAEYNSLRTEIISCQSARNNLYLFAFTIVGVFFTAAFSSQTPELLLLVPFLILAIQSRYYALSSQIAKQGKYIAQCIEPAVEGLKWERTSYEIRRNEKLKMKKQPFPPVMKYTFSILCVAALLAFFVLNPPASLEKPESQTQYLYFAVAMLASIFVVYNENRFLRGKLYHKWHKNTPLPAVSPAQPQAPPAQPETTPVPTETTPAQPEAPPTQ